MTEHTNEPTVEELLEQQKNLTQQLVYANQKIISLQQALDVWQDADLSLLIYIHCWEFKEKLFKKIKGWFQ